MVIGGCGAVGRGDDHGGGLRVLVVQDVGVEGLVIGGNGVEDSSDGANEVKIDDETPGDAFCVEGHWAVEQLELWGELGGVRVSEEGAGLENTGMDIRLRVVLLPLSL